MLNVNLISNYAKMCLEDSRRFFFDILVIDGNTIYVMIYVMECFAKSLN